MLDGIRINGQSTTRNGKRLERGRQAGKAGQDPREPSDLGGESVTRERAVAVALYGQSIQYPPSRVLLLTFLHRPQRLYEQSI